MLEVITPAGDRNLLTLDELRAAAGVSNSSSDAKLLTLGARISAAIVAACKITRAGATPPTLRKETLKETLRLGAARCRGVEHILLSRRPIVSVASVLEDDVTLTVDTDFEVDFAAGTILRLSSVIASHWYACKVVVTYDAGWATVPDELKAAASKLATAWWSTSTRDPNLKRTRTEGVGEREYWVGTKDEPAIPADVMELLQPFRNKTFASA